MKIKSFNGKSIEDALKGVRAAFGDDAVILSTRKNGGVAEVIAAIDFDAVALERELGGGGGEGRRDEGLLSIKEELVELRTLLSSVMGDRAKKDLIRLGRGAVQAYEDLLRRGLDERLSQRLIRAAAIATSDGHEALKARCMALIKERASVTNPLAGGHGPKILALVGPTGAGKTTTIAKIAGQLGKRSGAKVSLVSLDNERPGGVAAIRQCGRALGMGVETPRSKEELARTLWQGREMDVILIDTPGVSPSDEKGVARLGAMLSGGFPVKIGLVMSVTDRDDAQGAAMRGFGALPLDHLVYTRLDEGTAFGSMINASMTIKKPIAYLCNGQRIPRDIGVATGEAVGNLIFG